MSSPANPLLDRYLRSRRSWELALWTTWWLLAAAANSAVGSQYDFGYWPKELLYEYLKDVRTYASTITVVYLYRLLLLRLQGEARLLTAPCLLYTSDAADERSSV